MLIRNFALNAVELTEPVLENAFYREQEYLRSKEAEPSVHMSGRYMTALSQLFAATGTKDIEERIDYILCRLAECQSDSGYLFASSGEPVDCAGKEEASQTPWDTVYNVLSGLISAYQLGKRPQALEIAVKLGMWVYSSTSSWTDEVHDKVIAYECGGMSDCLYELYKETGRKEFVLAAGRFDDVGLIEQIAEGRDILRGRNVDTVISKILGALNRYFALGEPEQPCLQAACTFFDLVAEKYTYITGDIGEGGSSMAAFNMMRLAEELFFVTGEKRYMDYYERALLNAILGSTNPETCMESFTKLNSAIYHKGEGRLYVDLYLSSVLDDKKSGIKLTQKTDLKHFDSVTFRLAVEDAREFTLALRLPDWTNQHFELLINGETTDYSVQKGYILLNRTWNGEEIISLKFFSEIALHVLPDAPCSAAVTYGPFVMAAAQREKIMIKNISVREWFADCRKNFVKLEGETAFFTLGTDADSELLFTPYYKHYNDRYGIYFEYCAETGLSEDELRELARKQLDYAENAAKKMRKRNGILLPVVGHAVGLLVLILLLYLFAEPVTFGISKAKKSIDTFLRQRVPGIAEVFGVQGDDNAVDGDSFEEQEKNIPRYVDNPEEYAASCVLPEGYRAFVEQLDGREYICVEGKGLRAHYPNEIQAEGRKYIYLETVNENAVYFWDYSFDLPQSLCFERGVYNTSGAEQFAYFEGGEQAALHLLDAGTLREYDIDSYSEKLALLADVGAYTEVGDEVLLDTVICEKSYLFSVPRAEGTFEVSAYVPRTDYGLAYTLEPDGIRFDSYVVSGGVYIGKTVGRLSLSGHSYVPDSLVFYAYAEDDYADDGDMVIHGVSPAEADSERIAIVGDLGERLLVPVRGDVKKHSYSADGFIKEADGEYHYEENGQTVSIKGIDVSKYQENIDWEKVAASGVEFAMIRLGFRGMGSKGTCELDPYFKQNVQGALSAGIDVGVYFFTQATTVEEAKEEAAFVIENLKGYNITWPVVFDTEEITSYKAARANSLPRSVRTACAKAFLKEIEAAGYTPMLYANTRWSIMKLDLAELAEFDFWYAYYGDSIYYPYDFTMWQYTASGKVDGIKENADLNISFVDYGAGKRKE